MYVSSISDLARAPNTFHFPIPRSFMDLDHLCSRKQIIESGRSWLSLSKSRGLIFIGLVIKFASSLLFGKRDLYEKPLLDGVKEDTPNAE